PHAARSCAAWGPAKGSEYLSRDFNLLDAVVLTHPVGDGLQLLRQLLDRLVTAEEGVPDRQLLGVHAVVHGELDGEDVIAGRVQQVRLRDQRGRTESVVRNEALDDGRCQLLLDEVLRRLLRE